ncbi:MAG: SDR family oxidoreductase [Pseudomonadota bacterium]|nr:SDR family oxidoreductase [Pseudomonadota bacterium]
MSKNILLFGGTGRTGLHIAKLLSNRGDNVTAVARPSTDKTKLIETGSKVFSGNPLNEEDINNVFDESSFDAVISSLGHRRGEPEPRADLVGMKMIIDAAKSRSIKRLLMITMIGAGDSIQVVSDKVIEFLGVPIKAKTEAEEYLKNSELDFTILRPGGLNDGPESGTGEMHEECIMGVISTADLAQLTLKCLDNDSSIGKTYHTIDPEIKEVAPLQRGENLPLKK